MNRIDVIQHFIYKNNAKTYLEIGVRHGESFMPIQCETKVGVDPHIVNGHIWKQKNEFLFGVTSDEFFKKYCDAFRFDVIFIDGLHTFEQSEKDVNNSLKVLNDEGVILLHDCYPLDEKTATPTWTGESPDWSGEVWKTILLLRTRKDLNVSVLVHDYGIGIVTKGNQKPLDYTKEEISKMTYNDLDKNRSKFLNLRSSL